MAYAKFFDETVLQLCLVLTKLVLCHMHLGPKTSLVKLAFLSVWQSGYSLNYILWRTGVINANLNPQFF